MDSIWFQTLSEIKKDLTERGISEEKQAEIIQDLKSMSLKKINLHGNMLNLRTKHINLVQEYYKEILNRHTIQV